jgi:hypothetical protein
MKIWVLRNESAIAAGYWTGDGLMFTPDIDRAVQFVRGVDAERVLVGLPLLDARPFETELSDRDEPGMQSVAQSGTVNL